MAGKGQLLQRAFEICQGEAPELAQHLAVDCTNFGTTEHATEHLRSESVKFIVDGKLWLFFVVVVLLLLHHVFLALICSVCSCFGCACFLTTSLQLPTSLGTIPKTHGKLMAERLYFHIGELKQKVWWFESWNDLKYIGSADNGL